MAAAVARSCRRSALVVALGSVLALSACALNEGSDAADELRAWYPEHELDGLTLDSANGQNVLPGAGSLTATYTTTDRSSQGIVSAADRICQFDPEVDLDELDNQLSVGRLLVPLDCSDPAATMAVAAWEAVGDDTSVVSLDLGFMPELRVVDRAAARRGLVDTVPALQEAGWFTDADLPSLSVRAPVETEVDFYGNELPDDVLDVVVAVLDVTPPDQGVDIDVSLDPDPRVDVRLPGLPQGGVARLEREVVDRVPGARGLLTLSGR